MENKWREEINRDNNEIKVWKNIQLEQFIQGAAYAAPFSILFTTPSVSIHPASSSLEFAAGAEHTYISGKPRPKATRPLHIHSFRIVLFYWTMPVYGRVSTAIQDSQGKVCGPF
jgi:hypothetical protein